jgi:hypothetical protein
LGKLNAVCVAKAHHPLVKFLPVSEHALSLAAWNAMDREPLFLFPADDRADISP